MQAFLNDPKVKEKYLERVKRHFYLDHIVQKRTWNHAEQKGCSVGCIFEHYYHKLGPIEIGFPTWIIHFNDSLFEGMHPEMIAKDYEHGWTYQFLNSAQTGADLDTIKNTFIIYVLQSALNTFDNVKYDRYAKVIIHTIELFKSGVIEENYMNFVRANAELCVVKITAKDDIDTAKKVFMSDLKIDGYYNESYYSARAVYLAISSVVCATADMFKHRRQLGDFLDYAALAESHATEAKHIKGMPRPNRVRERKHKEFADKLLELMKSCEGG